MKPIVPQTFDVPTHIDTHYFTLRVLQPKYAKLDYKAIKESKDTLSNIFSEQWPDDVCSPEKNLEYIMQDYQDFVDRVGFSYIVLNKEENKCLGSIYIFPSFYQGYEVTVYYWLHIDLQGALFEKRFDLFVHQWLEHQWPFTSAAFPGRDIPWSKWLSLPLKRNIDV